jgi:hypothetical protein
MSDKKSRASATFTFVGLCGWWFILSAIGDTVYLFCREWGYKTTPTNVEVLSFEDQEGSTDMKAKLKKQDGSVIDVEYIMLSSEYVKEARNLYKIQPGNKTCAHLLLPTDPTKDQGKTIKLSYLKPGFCKQ